MSLVFPSSSFYIFGKALRSSLMKFVSFGITFCVTDFGHLFFLSEVCLEEIFLSFPFYNSGLSREDRQPLVHSSHLINTDPASTLERES